jgi:hypothetical protein
MIVVDNSGSMTYSLIEGAVDIIAENFTYKRIFTPCSDERWLRWITNAHTISSIALDTNPLNICSCYEENEDSSIDLWSTHKLVHESLGQWDDQTRTFTITVKYTPYYDEINDVWRYEYNYSWGGFEILIPHTAQIETLSLYRTDWGLSYNGNNPTYYEPENGHFYTIAHNIPVASFSGPVNIDRLLNISVSIGGCTHSYTFRQIINFEEE